MNTWLVQVPGLMQDDTFVCEMASHGRVLMQLTMGTICMNCMFIFYKPGIIKGFNDYEINSTGLCLIINGTMPLFCQEFIS